MHMRGELAAWLTCVITFTALFVIDGVEGGKLRIINEGGLCWRAFGDGRLGLSPCEVDDFSTEFRELDGNGLEDFLGGTRLESMSKPGYCLARDIVGFQIHNLRFSRDEDQTLNDPWCLRECTTRECGDIDLDRGNNVILMDHCVGESTLWVNDENYLKNVNSGRCLSACLGSDCQAGPVIPPNINSPLGHNVQTETCSDFTTMTWDNAPSPMSGKYSNFTVAMENGGKQLCLDTCLDTENGCDNLRGVGVDDALFSKIERHGRNVYAVECGDFNAGTNQAWRMVPQPVKPEVVLRDCKDQLVNSWRLEGEKVTVVKGSLETTDPCASVEGSKIFVKDCTSTGTSEVRWSIVRLDEQEPPIDKTKTIAGPFPKPPKPPRPVAKVKVEEPDAEKEPGPVTEPDAEKEPGPDRKRGPIKKTDAARKTGPVDKTDAARKLGPVSKRGAVKQADQVQTQDAVKKLGQAKKKGPAKKKGAIKGPDPVKKTGAGTKPDPVKKSGADIEPGPVKKSGAGTKPDPVKKSGAGTKPDPVKKSGADIEPGPVKKSGAGTKPDPVKKSGAGTKPDPVKKSGAGTEPGLVKRAGSGKEPGPEKKKHEVQIERAYKKNSDVEPPGPVEDDGKKLPWKTIIILIICGAALLLFVAIVVYLRNKNGSVPEPKPMGMGGTAPLEAAIFHKQQTGKDSLSSDSEDSQLGRRGSYKNGDLPEDEEMGLKKRSPRAPLHNQGSAYMSSGSSSKSVSPSAPPMPVSTGAAETGGAEHWSHGVTREHLQGYVTRERNAPDNPSPAMVVQNPETASNVSKVVEATAGLTAGSVFAGRYVMESEQIIGTSGVICLARNQFNRQPVAIKFYADHDGFQAQREMHRIVSPQYLVRLEDVLEAANGYPPALVFERGDYTMQEWLQRSRPQTLSQKLALHQVVEALNELHKHHIVHRDLKPSNIMWFSMDHTWKFTDLDSWARATEPAPIAYTLMYAAPEVAAADVKGKHEVILETSTDMFSFGVLAYEVTTGSRFYGSQELPDQVREYLFGFAPMPSLGAVREPQVRRLIENLTKADPKARWSSSAALQNAYFRSADDTMQKQDTWNKVTQQLSRIEQMMEATAKEIRTANMMATITIEDIPDVRTRGMWAQCKGEEVFIAEDDTLPEQPIFMLPLKKEFRLRLAITHLHNLPVEIDNVRYIQISVGDGRPVILQPEKVATSQDMWEGVALWDPQEMVSDLLSRPTPESGPAEVRFVALEVVVAFNLGGQDVMPTEVRGRVFCRMHKAGSSFPCRKLFRRVSDKWQEAPQFIRDGAKGVVLLMKVAVGVAGM